MDFYSTLVACKTRLKIKGEEFEDKNRFKKIWIYDNLLPKLSRNLKIKSRYAESRRIYPDGRTRGGHVRKRVTRGHAIAAEKRP